MVQGYYTLEEAAQFLGISGEELKQKARSKEIRSFQDRGTLHFRIQDIQELGRQRSVSSDPDLPLADAPLSNPRTPRTPSSSGGDPEIFDFEFDADQASALGGEPSSGRRGGPKSPHGSDSDVRLVADGSELSIGPGGGSAPKPPSDIGRRSKLGPPASGGAGRPSKLAPGSGASGTRPSQLGPITSGNQRASKLGSNPPAPSPRPSRLGGAGGSRSRLGGPASPASPASPAKTPRSGNPQPADSGVRLVPMDSDSDVRIVAPTPPADEIDLGGHGAGMPTDSSVRLEGVSLPPLGGQDMNLTEEINLDEEIKRQEEAQRQVKQPRVKPKSELRFPQSSPFELSEADVDVPRKGPHTSDSSDYDLVPGEEGRLEPATDDFSLDLGDDVPGSGEGDLTGPTSGISLSNPVDAGISLEDPAQAMDFDLSLEVEATPRPHASVPAEESSEFELARDPADAGTESSEYELSLDPDPASVQDDTSSEFELSLDAPAPAPVTDDSDSEFEINTADDSSPLVSEDSDSEFELTLDDSGQAADAPQVKASTEEEQDIFETDFEMPELDEGSSETGDTDLESSDFDLALDDSDVAAEDESGSQVVALDEEEIDASLEEEAYEADQEVEEVAIEEDEDAAAEADDFGDLSEAEAEERAAPAAVREVVKEKWLRPAPWGVMPVVFMLPCVVVMVLVGLLGFELVQSSNGYKAPGPLTKAVAELIGQKIR